AGAGAPVRPATVVGYPRRQLPAATAAGTVENLRTEAEHLVISGGVVVPAPPLALAPARKLDLFIVGNRWLGGGNSGGPVVTPGFTGQGVEPLEGLYQGDVTDSRLRRMFRVAVGAPAIGAFLRAFGPGVIPGAPPAGGAGQSGR